LSGSSPAIPARPAMAHGKSMYFKVFKKYPLIFIALLVLLIFCWIEVDLYAPAFPQLRRFFGTTEEMIQLTLSLNILG
jgi:uncharacterized protein Usg